MKTYHSKVFSSPYFYGFILIICCVIVFSPTLFNGFFCWDDKDIALAPAFRHLTFAGIIHSFSSFHMGLYHPLTSVSFMLDYFTGNGSPFPFHLTNLILHAANTLLVFILLIRLTGNFRLSFITGLLFAVHPVHVEAVAWVTSRKDLLFTFFALLSVIFYIDFSGKKQKLLYYLLVFFSVLFALLSKVQAVSLPFIFLLVDYLRGEKFKARIIAEKVPFFLLCLFFGWINILAQQDYNLISYGYHFSIPEKAFLLIYSVSRYFIKILIPYPLSVFYPFPFRPGEPIPLAAFSGPLIFITVLVSVIIFKWKEKRMIIFGFLFFLLNIIIVALTSLNRDFIMADRYAYISSAGILLVISVIADHLIRNYPKYRILSAGLILLFAGFLSLSTIRRNIMWKDPLVLFENALSSYNNSDIILNTLASQEIEAGRYEEAISHLNKAIRIGPGYREAFFNRGIAYMKTGDFKVSIDDFTRAIKINPAYDEAYFARGSAYMKSNDLQNAYDDFTMVIRINRNHFGAFQDRAIVRGNLGDFAGAIEDLDAAIALNPGFAASYYLRGIALFNTGGNGCTDLNKALSMGYKEAMRAIEHYCR